MIGLLVIAPLGYSLFNGDDDDKSKVTEGDIDFYRENGLWKAALDGRVFGFQNLPSEVENVSIEGVYDIGQYTGQPIYFVGSNQAVSEILSNIADYVLRYQEACVMPEGFNGSDEDLNESFCNGDLPVKDCNSNLIIFEEGDEDMVYQNGNCVYIVGDYIKGADAFLYEVLHF